MSDNEYEPLPIVPHYACIEPSDEKVICRFIDFGKFRDFFANEELYLRRVDLFKETDPNEALPSDDYVRRVLGLNKYDLHDELKLNNDQAFNRQNSEGYYLNCWQLFEGETLNMWNAYGNGIAIFSRFGLLRAALNSLIDPIFTGVVRYGEKDLTRYNLVDFLFRKRRHFDKEKELRIVLQCYDPMAGVNRHFDENNFPHREPLDDQNPLHPWVHACKRRRIDLKSFVTEIRLWPGATPEEHNEVEQWVKNKNLTCPVVSSELMSPFSPTAEEMKKLGL